MNSFVLQRKLLNYEDIHKNLDTKIIIKVLLTKYEEMRPERPLVEL
jgi:hypothetical protein